MRFFFIVSSLLCFVVAHAQDINYTTLLLDKSLTENANSVVRKDYMKIDIESPRKMQYLVHQATTVLNRKGNGSARTHVSYDKETEIKKLDVFVYDEFGKQIDHIKKKDFKDISAADGFSLYTDNRLLTYDYTPIRYPYTLELIYEIETSDTGFFPPWYFLGGYATSVANSHYEINYTDDRLRPEIKKHNLEGILVNEEEATNRFVFTAKNIPAMKREMLSPGFREIAPRLSVRLNYFNLKGHSASVTSWEDMGVWMDETLLKGQAVLTPETIAKAKRLVANAQNDLEKAKIIYKYVQDNTRYISVQIGIGGWKPISAIEVDRVKYGDCKGLSNYTYALLKAVGVTSYYAVIHAGQSKTDFDADFAALQGNHAILAIPYEDEYYWIDCTTQVHPFGFVGHFTDDRQALIVTPSGGKIVRTVAYVNEQNHLKTNADYHLSVEGAIKGTARINSAGVRYDNHFQMETESKEDVIKYYKSYWNNINNLTIDDFSFENDREQILFTENVTFNAANYGSISGDRILFRVNALNRKEFVPNRYRNRIQPLDISRGFFDEAQFTVRLPQGYAIEAIPEDKNITTEFGSYSMKVVYNSEEHTITYKRDLLVKKGRYPKEKYHLYRDFRKQVARNDSAQIVLIKTNS